MTLGHTVTDALTICDQMRAAGHTKPEIFAALEGVLRSTWPFQREWNYLCEACRDTGLEILDCPARPCDRRVAHGDHDYGIPCRCPKGDRWRARARTADDAVTAAAKTAKPKQRTFQQAGR